MLFRSSFTALTAAGSFPRLPVLIEAIKLKADAEVFTALKRAASDSISSGELILKSSGKSESADSRESKYASPAVLFSLSTALKSETMLPSAFDAVFHSSAIIFFCTPRKFEKAFAPSAMDEQRSIIAAK